MSEKLIEELREHVAQLKEEVQDEKNKLKSAHNEKVREIKTVREEEQAIANEKLEEQAKKLQRQLQAELTVKFEAAQRDFDKEMAAQRKAHSTELQKERNAHEQENKNLEEKLQLQITTKVKAEIETEFSAESKKLLKALDGEREIKRLQSKLDNLHDENKSLIASLQAKESEHKKEVTAKVRQSKLESQKQVEELKEKDKQLHAKEKEIAEIRRKCAQLEASEEKLKFELQIERKTRSPPVSAQVKGLDTQLDDETTGERVSPTMTTHEEVLLMRNSELGFMVMKQDEEIQSLRAEKAKLEKQCNTLKRETDPLREKNDNNLQHLKEIMSKLSTKEKQLSKVTFDRDALRKEKDKLIKQVHFEKEKQTTVDKKPIAGPSLHDGELAAKTLRAENIELKNKNRTMEEALHRLKRERTEEKLYMHVPPTSSSKKLPSTPTASAEQHQKEGERSNAVEVQKLQSQLRDKELVVRKVRAENAELTHKSRRVEEALQRLKREKVEEKPHMMSTTPKLQTSSLSPALASRRVDEHKKLILLEEKVEELNNKIVEERKTKARLNQRIEDLSASIKRRDHQMKTVSDENYKLKALNQTLEESKEHRKREKMEEWTQNRSELDQVHARNNKLQQTVSSLRDRLSQYEKVSSRSPTPTDVRGSSPTRSLHPLLPHYDHSSHVPPLYSSLERPTSPGGESLGSQWSLLSESSLQLREQVEQLEFNHEEIAIKYDEMKKEYGTLKGRYNTVRERYQSLLNRSRNIERKLQIANKERLLLEKDTTKALAAEYNSKREDRLQQKLEDSNAKISQLQAQIEEKQGASTDKSQFEELLSEEVHKNQVLENKVRELENQVHEAETKLAQQETQLSLMNAPHQDQSEKLNKMSQEMSRLEILLAEKESQLAALQQQVQEEAPTPETPPTSTLQPLLQDHLQTAQDVLKQIQHANTNRNDAHDHSDEVSHLGRLAVQLENLLQNSLTSTPPVASVEETDAPAPQLDALDMSKQFQSWYSQFEAEKKSLKATIKELEHRVSKGSERVLELQDLVTNMESELLVEKSRRAEAEKLTILSPPHLEMPQPSPAIQTPPIPQSHGQRVNKSITKTSKALNKGNLNLAKREFSKHNKHVSELLQVVYPQGLPAAVSTPSPTKLSPKLAAQPHHDSLASLSPYPSPSQSPFQLSPASSSQQSPAASPRMKKLRLFVTLFDHNPDSLCSTGHPERELHLYTGNIIEVEGEMDKHGYYLATFEGKHGRVPASFVQEMSIGDVEAQQRLANQSVTRSFTSSVTGSEVSVITSSIGRRQLQANLSSSLTPPTITSTPTYSTGHPVPPSRLTVEKSVSGDTLLLSWYPPKIDENGRSNGYRVTGYSILYNGMHKVDVSLSHTRYLLSDVDPAQPHTLSMCSTSEEGPTSPLITIQYIGSPPPAREHKVQRSVSARSSADSDIMKAKLMLALYDYTPATESPNPYPELELSFKKNQVLTIYGDMRDDGFYNGELGGKFGLVPSNFIIDFETMSSSQNSHTPSLEGHTPSPDQKFKRKLFNTT